MKRTLCVLMILVAVLSGTSADEDEEWIRYTMRSGDTLYSLSRRFSVSLEDILVLNGISDPLRIREGESIVIPGVREISRGETLYGLSRRYGIPLRELLEANDLEESSLIRVGQRIRIPGGFDRQDYMATNGSPGGSDNGENSRSADADESSAGSQANDEPGPEWPHSGDRRAREGRVPGVAIQAAAGDTVYAVASGRVTFIGPYAGFGRVVIVESSGGYIYVYGGHSSVNVSLGDRIERGSVLGSVGTIGDESEVHFSVWRDDAPVDPAEAPRS